MKTLGIIILVLVILLFSGLAFILTRSQEPEPVIDPSAPGVHYYEECDYKGKHKLIDVAPSVIGDSFKSVRVPDDFAVKAMSTTDEEVFIKGPSTVKCTEFKSMEVLPN
jgi:hypothetical protein